MQCILITINVQYQLGIDAAFGRGVQYLIQCSYQHLTAEGHIKFNDVGFTND